MPHSSFSTVNPLLPMKMAHDNHPLYRQQSSGCSCCLCHATVSKENPGVTDCPAHLHPDRFPNLHYLWPPLSPRLCSISSCKFIFPAPPCQHHPVFLWRYRHCRSSESHFLSVMTTGTILQSPHTTVPTIWASGKHLLCTPQGATQLPMGLLGLEEQGELQSAHLLNPPLL